MDFLVQIVPTATNNMLWPNLAKFRNLKSVIRKLCSHIIRKLWVLCNQEAMYQKGLPQKLVIWPDVQSAGVLLRSHKIQESGIRKLLWTRKLAPTEFWAPTNYRNPRGYSTIVKMG
jgi:hypothetical protein